VFAKSLRNGANHGFLAPAEDLRGRQGLRRWNECKKAGEQTQLGYIGTEPGKQNGNSVLNQHDER
jgi:hypothetical protein